MVNDNLTFAVAGTGYVGMSMSVLLSQKYRVIAVDIIKEKVDLINQRKSPIQDDYVMNYLENEDLSLENDVMKLTKCYSLPTRMVCVQ